VKSYCRDESVALYVRRNAGYVVTVAPQIEIHDFALHRYILRQPKLETQADVHPALTLQSLCEGASIRHEPWSDGRPEDAHARDIQRTDMRS
jgi:hypothetical protein